MRARLSLLLLLSIALAGCGHGTGSANSCTGAKPFGCNSPSRSLAEPLRAAQYAIKTRNLALAIQKHQEAQAAKGQKTAYDEYIINSMLGVAYCQTHDYARAAPAMEAAARSKYADPERAEEWMQTVEPMRR